MRVAKTQSEQTILSHKYIKNWNCENRFPVMSDSTLVTRLLEVIEKDILPLTAIGVSAGNKIFGAAILRKSDLSLVIAETNNEQENPLWHGEIHTLKRFYELADHPPTGELIFLSTHEPCSMCMSAITWAGFDNFYYFFSHEDSRDSFAIPHDLRILKEVFTLDPGGYNHHNDFWDAYSISDMIASIPDDESKQFLYKKRNIIDRYESLSETYQSSKAQNDIPLN